MAKTYVADDLQTIQQYFPGAHRVNVSTPFDKNESVDPWRLRLDNCDQPAAIRWLKDML